MSAPFIVGAYAALPAMRANREEFYECLAAQSWVDGLEVPFRAAIDDDLEWFISQLSDSFTTNVLTPIPGVMHKLADNPDFGLASPDEGGRAAALDYLLNASWAMKAVNDALGRRFFSHVAIHSAPTKNADVDAFTQSLTVATEWDWDGATLVVEHQDAFIAGQDPQKGFLSLADELDAIARVGSPNVKSAINWGRSAIEGRSADTPLEHIRQASQAGMLAGVIFSGAHATDSSYGPAWTDAHAPLVTHEESSIMTSQLVAAAARAALDVDYLGAKITLDENLPLTTRIDALREIASAAQA